MTHNHDTKDESVYRCLVCLGNTLHASRSQEEVGPLSAVLNCNNPDLVLLLVQVRQLLQSMEASDLVTGCQSRGGKVAAAASEILQMLKSGESIDLD